MRRELSSENMGRCCLVLLVFTVVASGPDIGRGPQAATDPKMEVEANFQLHVRDWKLTDHPRGPSVDLDLGEPAWVAFQACNRSSRTIALWVCPEGGAEWKVEATDASGEAVESGVRLLIDYPLWRFLLKPGETYRKKFLLSKWCLFQKPGMYTVKAYARVRVSDWYGKAERQPQFRFSEISDEFVLNIGPMNRARLEEILGRLEEDLENKDREVRREAVEAAAWVGDPMAVPYLVKVLHDKDSEIVREAIYALGRSPGAESVNGLISVLDSTDPELRAVAASCLQKLKAKEAVPSLIPLLRDDDHFVRMQVAIALGELGDPTALPHLKKMLDDPDPEVRKFAALAVEKLSKEAQPD